MRLQVLLCSVIFLVVLESALGCFCLRNRGGVCNCLPRARLWLKKPRRIVAVIQPLPQDQQIIRPNICRCGRPLLPSLNPILPPDLSDGLQDCEQPAFGARCLCTKQVRLPNIRNLFNPSRSICGCGLTTCTCIAPFRGGIQ